MLEESLSDGQGQGTKDQLLFVWCYLPLFKEFFS